MEEEPGNDDRGTPAWQRGSGREIDGHADVYRPIIHVTGT